MARRTNSIMESVLTRTSWNTNAPLGSVSGCTGHRKHRVYMRLKWKSCLPQIASVNYIHRTQDNFPCTQGPSSSLSGLLRGLDKEQWRKQNQQQNTCPPGVCSLPITPRKCSKGFLSSGIIQIWTGVGVAHWTYQLLALSKEHKLPGPDSWPIKQENFSHFFN